MNAGAKGANARMKTYALIPAAGKSRRMGQPKLLLPVGERTVLEHVLAAVRDAGVADTLVVVAPDNEALARCAADAGADVLRLDEDTADMRATCERGLAWIADRFHPHDHDGWLLLPADHPTVRPDVIGALLDAACKNLECTIIVPVYQGRRGHPTWLRWSHVAAILAMPPEQGLNAFIRSHAEQTLELPWPSDDILADLDTPEDYQRLIGK
jgi:molybdenum cofactor cytidylyltransferase